MGGDMPVARAQLVDAYLGQYSWGQRIAYIPDNSANQPSGLSGLLGTVALGKRVAFDTERKVVAWEPREPPVTTPTSVTLPSPSSAAKPD